MPWAGWENFGQISRAARDPKNQYRGRCSHDLGEAFENIISAACKQLELQGSAKIEKTPEPFKVTDKLFRNGKFLGFIGFFTKPAQPDFKGTLVGGRAVCFEAKATMKDRIEYDAVTKEQRAALEKHWVLGARVFVLVSFRLSKFYRIPWDIWREMQALYGRKYMIESELSAFEIPIAGVLKNL